VAEGISEDHRKMIKARLESFLQITADVDYNAALKEEYRQKKFVNSVYEKKPAEWKMAIGQVDLPWTLHGALRKRGSPN
jgi:hypothetical protein